MLALSLYVAGCSGEDKPKKPPINEQTMTDILVDMHILEARADELQARPDSIAFLLEDKYNELYQKHSVTKEDFQTTFNYYQQQPKLMDELYQGVIDELTRMEVEIKALPDSTAADTKQ